MDIRTDNPFWLLKNGFMEVYPSLKKDFSTDYAIIGGGITGAFVAWYLAKAGIETAVFDRRHIGMGSTCASTSLLQYEIDTPLFELAETVGEKNAARSYQLCIRAIDEIEKICKKLKVKTDFERKPSLYLASRKKDFSGILEKEFSIRRKHKINVELWDEKQLADKFSFENAGALYSPKDAAQLDVYRMTHGLFQDAISSGAKVFDKTEIEKIERGKRGVALKTKDGFEINAKKIIIACGYESVNYLPENLVRLHSTFALASEPFTEKNLWHENCLIWETARPYLYMRTTADNRIIVGGKDEPFQNPAKRDKLLNKKTRLIVESFKRKFPEINLIPDYAWAGTFGETKDGLPYIGSVKQVSQTIFALGFGGNGITFSQIAAEIIRDEATGKKNSDAKIFSFDRSQ